jgi:acetyl-CoA carboxylase biotin carboxyl carrier protein
MTSTPEITQISFKEAIDIVFTKLEQIGVNLAVCVIKVSLTKERGLECSVTPQGSESKEVVTPQRKKFDLKPVPPGFNFNRELDETESNYLSRLEENGFNVIKAPIVGTVYFSKTEGGPRLVSLGDVVEAEQVVCIIEAMKLMNEIEAEREGVICHICVENGQPVEYGQPLFILNEDNPKHPANNRPWRGELITTPEQERELDQAPEGMLD